MSNPTFFNAHHAPIGAFASLTFGAKGPHGGLGLEIGGPAKENLYVGVEDRENPGQYHALPFFQPCDDHSNAEDYDVEGLSAFRRDRAVTAFPDSEVTRRLGAAIDEWKADDLTFRVASPVRSVPDPETGSPDELRDALTPAVVAELTIDNRKGTFPRKAFFGYSGSDRSSGMRVWQEDGVVGIGQGLTTAIATADSGVYGGTAWQPEAILEPHHQSNLLFLLGSLGLLVGTVAAGEVRTFRFCIAFFREGTVTTGTPARYLYRRWFDSIEAVARHGLDHAEQSLIDATEFDRRLFGCVSPARGLMLAHAIRSYYGSTQCLELGDGRAFWVVNEGEYRMMNTLDLAVDQAFFELAVNPWTVRNELDFYLDDHSYQDEVRFPGDTKTYPGGIVFTHDMGVANALAERGRSGYEQAGLHGCFSFMAGEELVNWVLSACLYANHTGDHEWVQRRATKFGACLTSLANRDHPDPARRNGVIGLDTSRCEGGSEITTYDSLDASLGQARNNLYLAVKTWAAYVLLESLFSRLGNAEQAADAAAQANRCAVTIAASADGEGFLPAVLGEGVAARIIPAIEGLVYPYMAGCRDALALDGPYADLIAALGRHFDAALRPGVCLFADGGWQLSSTSRNSWLSKIYLCQFVAEQILGKEVDAVADRVHLGWLMREDNAYFAWSDQMLEGKAVGSRYYPRGVTGILWTDAGGCLHRIRERLLGRNRDEE